MDEQQNYQTVSELNQRIHAQFDANSANQTVYLIGEISNYRPRRGTQYFSLKDAGSSISVIIFPSVLARLNCELADGQKVLIVGRLTTYVPYGTYQIQIHQLVLSGVGQLAQKLKQLKETMLVQGYFAAEHKLPLPRFPRKIGVITSPSGAVIRDILTTVRRRYPLSQIILYPAVVQGTNSATDLRRQFQRLVSRDDIDTIIIGRGGGSIEDLWSFNDEALAKLVYNSTIPVISSVGHETDNTLLDLVADKRAATPTAAAELAVPDKQELLAQLTSFDQQLHLALQNKIKQGQVDLMKLVQNPVFENPMVLYQRSLSQVNQMQQQLVQGFQNRLNRHVQTLQNLEYQLLRLSPEKQLTFNQTKFNQLFQQLMTVYQNRLHQTSQRWLALDTQLKAFDPTKIMQTGYSYVTKDSQVVKSLQQVHRDDILHLNLADGSLLVKVLSTGKDE